MNLKTARNSFIPFQKKFHIQRPFRLKIHFLNCFKNILTKKAKNVPYSG